MMARLNLNCPRCRRQLVNVPVDGLTLHYRCDEHGDVILRPLVEVGNEPDALETSDPDPAAGERHGLHAH
jgi:hypothetical protein